jgi:hypothetical protein
MEQGEIYMITNKTNGKKYIGQTVSYLSSGRKYGTSQRWNKHCSDAKCFVDDCKAFCNAIRKYGKDNFTVEILLKCNNNYLNEYEIKFIKNLNTISTNGYNLESGGCSQKVLHNSTKLKLSQCQRFLNIKDDDFFEFFKKKKYESVNESFDFIAREEIIRLNYLIYHHVDNYNESLITNRGYVNPTDLRFLKSILDRIVEKLENIEKDKIEINLSKDKTLN